MLKKTDYNSKISEIEGKIPSLSGLATNAALLQLKIKYHMLVIYSKKENYIQKISDMEKKVTDHDHDKYITTSEFNKLTAKSFAARLAQGNLVTKTDYDTKLISLNKKINSNKTKTVLVENEFKKLQASDSSYFRGKNYFEEDGTQNYSVFQPMYKYFKKIGNTDHISEWKSKVLSDEIKLLFENNNSLAPKLSYFGTKAGVKFNGSCLKQDKITYTHGTIVNIYIVYELSSSLNYNDNITLEKCLLGAFKLTKNADISKYKYFGYGVGFGGHGSFSFPSGGFGCNVIMFGVDMSSFIHVDNKEKDILILSEGPTQRLDGTTLTAEEKYSINFT